jgi:hypothetical protein
MADIGLLAGLGAGLNSGFQSYVQQRNYQEDQRRKSMYDALALKQAGQVQSPTGQLQDTPEMAAQKQAQSAKNTYEQGEYTAGSPQSTMYSGLLKQQYRDANPRLSEDQLNTLVPSNLPAATYEKGSGLIKSDVGGLLKLHGLMNKGSGSSVKDQNKSKQESIQLLESARGNPAASQAERDLYATSKMNSLVNLYPDPNKMPLTQVRLLSAEVGKIAQGGSPTMDELKGINPNNISQKFAGVMQNFSNEPTPANAGAFINELKKYSDSLSGDAQKVIEDKYGRIIESKKSDMGDDNYNTLKSQYIDRFKNQQQTRIINGKQMKKVPGGWQEI